MGGAGMGNMLGPWPRLGKGANWISDSLSEAPDVGPVKRWIYGATVAAVPVAYGVWRLIVGGPMTWERLKLKGFGVTLAAVVCIASGLLLHFHFLWAPHAKLWRVGRWGRTACLLVMVGAGMALVVWLMLFDVWRR